MLEGLVLLVFIVGLLALIVLSALAVMSCRTLQAMPDNGNENNTGRNSWTGPERSSYIAVATAFLLFIFSSILLASEVKFVIIVGIGLIVQSLMIPGTASLLAFAAMHQKRQLPKFFADHIVAGIFILKQKRQLRRFYWRARPDSNRQSPP